MIFLSVRQLTPFRMKPYQQLHLPTLPCDIAMCANTGRRLIFVLPSQHDFVLVIAWTRVGGFRTQQR